MRKLRLILLALVLILVFGGLGYWNIRPESFLSGPAPASDPENPIDFYVLNARTLQFQEDGRLNYELTAEKMEHQKADDMTFVEQPEMHLYRGEEIPWLIRSERAEVKPQGEEVELIDQVRVERTDARGRPTILTTTRLTLFPEREYAQTRQAVRIVAANGVTTAQGMKAYLNDSRMILQSNVRGQHEVR